MHQKLIQPIKIKYKLSDFFFLRYTRVYGSGDVWGEIRWGCRRVRVRDVHLRDDDVGIPVLGMPKCGANLPQSYKCKFVSLVKQWQEILKKVLSSFHCYLFHCFVVHVCHVWPSRKEFYISAICMSIWKSLSRPTMGGPVYRCKTQTLTQRGKEQ